MSQASLESDRVLTRLNQLHPKIIDLTLERVWRLLARLGNPQDKLAPVVHVAGTNGKGSTCAYLRAMAEAAGQRVQVYSSPHLVRFHERIRLAEGLISEDQLLALLTECEAANGGEPITFFEITTVAAFLAFARQPADLVILEVGLGGRLDATNVITHPAATVITPVSMDHMQYLGDTLTQIAFEKAGILKAGSPAIIAPQPAAAEASIRARAASLGVKASIAGRDWTFVPHEKTLEVAGQHYPHPRLLGPHQFENAATAVMTARTLQLPEAAIAAGLTTATWPARLQRLTQGPLVAALPAGWELWLDGGHNESAGHALAAQFDLWRDRPVHVIYGMLNTKAAQAFLAPLLGRAASLQAVAIPGEVNSLTAEEAASKGRGITPRASLLEALQALPPGPAARLLICGSLYLAGRVLAENG